VASYEAKSAKWTTLQGDSGRPVGINSYFYDGAKFVDSKRRRVVFYGSSPWAAPAKGEPALAKNQLYVFNSEKKDFETINGTGAGDFAKTKCAAYLPNVDKYLFVTDKGQYLFDPVGNQWKTLDLQLSDALKKDLGWCYLTFDTKRGLVILNNQRLWAVLRIDEKTLALE
jgi:hypothetical protein